MPLCIHRQESVIPTVLENASLVHHRHHNTILQRSSSAFLEAKERPGPEGRKEGVLAEEP